MQINISLSVDKSLIIISQRFLIQVSRRPQQAMGEKRKPSSNDHRWPHLGGHLLLRSLQLKEIHLVQLFILCEKNELQRPDMTCPKSLGNQLTHTQKKLRVEPKFIHQTKGSLDTRFKMAEQKDVLSLSLARAPESQLTAEQSSTGRHWNSPKKIPHI